MQLSVYSLKRTLFQDEASLLNCMTGSGEITVLDHHRPLISTLAEGTVKVVDSSGRESFFPVAGGFLKVGSRNDVLLMVDEQ